MIGKFPDYNVLIKKLKFLFTWFSLNHFEAYVKAKNYILQRGQVDKKTITGLARKFIVKQDSKGLWFVYPRQLFWQGQRIQPRLHVVQGNTRIGDAILKASFLSACKICSLKATWLAQV